jgi:hypothetical protein
MMGFTNLATAVIALVSVAQAHPGATPEELQKRYLGSKRVHRKSPEPESIALRKEAEQARWLAKWTGDYRAKKVGKVPAVE